jgi:RES domain
LLDTIALRPAFENVMTCYSMVIYGETMFPDEDPTDVGEYPAVLIQEDFELFSERLDDDDKQARLLEEILWRAPEKSGGPGFDGSGLYTRRETLFDLSLPNEWAGFCRQVKTDPTADWEFDNIDRWVRRTATVVPVGTVLFRARPGYDATGSKPRPFAGTHIGAPPKCEPGRVNGAHQRVLYCADQKATAISEVRPIRGEFISLCRVKIKTSIQIADVMLGLVPPNPFTTRNLRHELEIHEILRAFANQLAQPLDRRDDESDYVPCRYLANRIRSAGLGGIRYRSAMQRNGSNVVLFDPANAESLASKLLRISDVKVQYSAMPS